MFPLGRFMATCLGRWHAERSPWLVADTETAETWAKVRADLREKFGIAGSDMDDAINNLCAVAKA